ncbi:hypothetical protein F5Y15DRAFT_407896 [Xylariaceae sp. FL0016]|nr:hypothetical protein F5Y15DRAFT_407896 [Xylariaceae sp. FL0016]
MGEPGIDVPSWREETAQSPATSNMPSVKQEEVDTRMPSTNPGVLSDASSGLFINSASQEEFGPQAPAGDSPINANFYHLQQAQTAESVEELDSHRNGVDAIHWSQLIKQLINEAQMPQTVIGVLGGTGEGKSSAINALLDETRLLPANCVRACTAVITEVSYNHSDNPEHLYTAEIEFITVQEWQDELRHLFTDIKDPADDLSTELSNDKSDADIAWAKMKAVYPSLTSEDFARAQVEDFLNVPSVRAILGTTRTLRHPTVDKLYKAVKPYVDSKDKSAKRNGGNERELWPLIKVVRIHTKADVLSTGAVLVDLPGVQDSNAARAAIAEKYIAKCHGIWIVANITRATDDILMGEAAETFGLSRQVDDEKTDGARLENDRERAGALSHYVSELDKRLERWDKLSSRRDKGLATNAPKEIIRKRKVPAKNSRNRKRRRVDEEEATEDNARYASAGDFWDTLDDGIPKFDEGQELSESNIRVMIDFLKSQRLASLEQKIELEDQIENGENEGENLEAAYEDLKHNLKCLCIAKRNDYSSSALRKHFALGIRELLEDEIQGFPNADATQIPQLIEHAKRSTDVVRISHSKKILNQILKTMNSLYMWSSPDAFEFYLTEAQKRTEMDRIKDELIDLEKNLTIVVDDFVTRCKRTLTDNLIDHFKTSVSHANDRAPSIAALWVDRENGRGLGCITYKAICRRNGAFSGSRGMNDFNKDLAAPLKQALGGAWETTFMHEIPAALNEFTKRMKSLFMKLHDRLKLSLQQKATFTSINMLLDQVTARADGIYNVFHEFGDGIKSYQREASRMFTPGIQEKMTHTYTDCARDSGRGLFERMKATMMNAIQEDGEKIFIGATIQVEKKLIEMYESLDKDVKTSIADTLDKINMDYAYVLLGRNITKDSENARKDISHFLKMADECFIYLPPTTID